MLSAGALSRDPQIHRVQRPEHRGPSLLSGRLEEVVPGGACDLEVEGRVPPPEHLPHDLSLGYNIDQSPTMVWVPLVDSPRAALSWAKRGREKPPRQVTL